eukprot:jgi/Mesvir1/25183/Mv25902-RA.1
MEATYENLPPEVLTQIVKESWPYGCAINKATQREYDVVAVAKKEELSKKFRVNDLFLTIGTELSVRENEEADLNWLNPKLAERTDEQLRGVIKALSLERIEECEDAVYTPHHVKVIKLFALCRDLKEGVENIMDLHISNRTYDRIEFRLFDVASKTSPFTVRASSFMTKFYNQLQAQEERAGRSTTSEHWNWNGWWSRCLEKHCENYRNVGVLS